MAIPLLVVGGFLGAGMTTLVERAARRLSAEGLRVGIVTNDQATELVDTSLVESRGTLCSLRPGRPVPTHRHSQAVGS